MRKRTSNQSIHKLSTLTVLTLLCFPAYAQQQKEAQLPEVRVTSPTSKSPGNYVSTESSAGALGERSLVETPFSFNVITRELIEDQQAAYLGDYLKNDPSAVVSNVPVGFLTIRGFAVGTDGFLYDGMPGNLGLSDGRGQLEGVDRIEILKGAASFLYGQGGSSSLGGTINFIPKRATDEPVQSLTVGYTSKSLLGVHADFGNRFGENKQFGYRFNLALKDGEQALEGYN